jgi:hypothetical protein
MIDSKKPKIRWRAVILDIAMLLLICSQELTNFAGERSFWNHIRMLSSSQMAQVLVNPHKSPPPPSAYYGHLLSEAPTDYSPDSPTYADHSDPLPYSPDSPTYARSSTVSTDLPSKNTSAFRSFFSSVATCYPFSIGPSITPTPRAASRHRRLVRSGGVRRK